MSDGTNSNHAIDQLAAYADGELDAARRAEIERRAAADPALSEAIASHLRLRHAVDAVMRQVPLPSPALRQRLARMASDPQLDSQTGALAPAAPGHVAPASAASAPVSAGPGSIPPGPSPVSAAPKPAVASSAAAGSMRPMSSSHAQPTVSSRAGPPSERRWRLPVAWIGSIAAAVLILALGAFMGRLLPAPGAAGSPVPATYVEWATRVHVDCSRFPPLHTASWPQALGDLGPGLKQYLGRPVPYPDLSPIGYAYIGAGPCAKPLENAAHLLYRSTTPGSAETVSLFIQKDDGGKVPIKQGKVYRVAAPDSPHPMIVWRHANMVFYLVGDAETTIEKAAGQLHVPVPL